MAFFADLGRFPEAVVLPSRPVGEVWLQDYLLCFATCTWPTTLPSFSTATACRSKEFSSSTALYRVRKFVEGGGGLTARRKRKSSLLRPPLFFQVAKEGGVTAGQYGSSKHTAIVLTKTTRMNYEYGRVRVKVLMQAAVEVSMAQLYTVWST